MDEKKNTEDSAHGALQDRSGKIVRTSLVAVFTNIVLVVFKAVFGVLSNSISVVLDAVNNASDALSSIITIVGAKLASRSPDKKHPHGYGRLEYVSAMVVSSIVMYAGFTSFVESFKKILSPVKAEYSVATLVVLSAALFVKFFLGFFLRARGKKVKSQALEASGLDSLFDSVLSLSVLASAVVYMITGLSLEAYVGLVISVFIIKSGIEMLLETLNDILGRRSDPDVVRKIKACMNAEEGVRGTYDVILNNYGPEKNYASCHIEVPDMMSASEIDALTRKLERKVHAETGTILTGVGIYSYNTKDDGASKIRAKILEMVEKYDWILQMHGFYVDIENRSMRFDVVISFSVKGRDALKILYGDLAVLFPDYSAHISLDMDYSDL